MLKQLAKDIIYTATIAPAIEKAKEQIKSINENESLSDEERFGAITETINTILDDVIAQQAIGEELWETLKNLLPKRIRLGRECFNSIGYITRISSYVARYRE